MVNRVLSATALGRSGVTDWLIQRVSALVILAYAIFLLGFYLLHPAIDFTLWHALFLNNTMRIFSILTLLALLAHAWIGIWTILTDYVRYAYLRGTMQVIIIIGFILCFVWGIEIFWS